MSYANKIKSLLIKGFSSLREQGVAKTFYWVIYGYLRVNEFCIFVKDLQNDECNPPENGGISIRNIPIDELKEYRKNRTLPMHFYCDLFDDAMICFIAEKNKQIVHILWVYLENEPSRFFKKKIGQAEINYALTMPGNHGDNLYSKVLRYAHIWMKEKGYKKVLAATNIENLPAIKSIKRSGMKIRQNVKQIGPFRRKITIL